MMDGRRAPVCCCAAVCRVLCLDGGVGVCGGVAMLVFGSEGACVVERNGVA